MCERHFATLLPPLPRRRRSRLGTEGEQAWVRRDEIGLVVGMKTNVHFAAVVAVGEPVLKRAPGLRESWKGRSGLGPGMRRVRAEYRIRFLRRAGAWARGWDAFANLAAPAFPGPVLRSLRRAHRLLAAKKRNAALETRSVV